MKQKPLPLFSSVRYWFTDDEYLNSGNDAEALCTAVYADEDGMVYPLTLVRYGLYDIVIP